ncbi:MAG: LysR substrate-binding domain-containing protein [Burkholderiales bacterium]
MRLKQLRDFLAVVEFGGIRAAARKLGVSQPAISKSLRGLEAELQVRLIQRSPQGVALTSPGRTFFARAQAAQAELRKAEEELAQLAGKGQGSVAFGVGPLAAALVAPEAVVRFREQHPRARIRMVEGFPDALLPLIRDETLDFAVGPRADRKLGSSFRFRPLFRQQFTVVARKGHPLRNARALAGLAGAEWLSLWQTTSPEAPVNRVFSAADLPPPEQIVQCDSYNTLSAMLAKTDMLGMTSRGMLAAPFARELLAEIPVAEEMPMITIGIFTRAGSHLTPAAAAMAKCISVAARQFARPG